MNFSDEDIKQCAVVISGDWSNVSSTVKDSVNQLIENFNNEDFESTVKGIEQSTDFSPSDIVYLIRVLTDNNIALTYTKNPYLKDIVDNYASLCRAARELV